MQYTMFMNVHQRLRVVAAAVAGAVLNVASLRAAPLCDVGGSSWLHDSVKERWPCGTQSHGYTFGKELGMGDMGVVYEVVDAQNNKWALKIAKRKRGGERNQEAAFLLALPKKHPNILTVYEIQLVDGWCLIRTELCKGGDLWEFARERWEAQNEVREEERSRQPLAAERESAKEKQQEADKILPIVGFTEREIANIMSQLFSAVAFLHANGIVHNDVKCSNVYIVNDAKELRTQNSPFGIQVKLGDFGVARKGPRCDNGIVEGPMGSLPPEKALYGEHAAPGDVWNLGVLVCHLVAAECPLAKVEFDELAGTSPEVWKRWTCWGQWVESYRERSADELRTEFIERWHPYDRVTPALKDLLSRMLHPCPQKRPTAQECLESQWMQDMLPPEKLQLLKEHASVASADTAAAPSANDKQSCSGADRRLSLDVSAPAEVKKQLSPSSLPAPPQTTQPTQSRSRRPLSWSDGRQVNGSRGGSTCQSQPSKADGRQTADDNH